jgi:hypothetical protein
VVCAGKPFLQSPEQQPEGGSVEKGFLESLFDLDFKTFVTGRVVKVLYILTMIGAGIWFLITLFVGGHSGGGGFLLALIGGLVAFFLIVMVTRVYLELVMVLFKIEDNTSKMLERMNASGE